MVFDGVKFSKKIKEELLKGGKLVGKSLVIFQTGEKESLYVGKKRKMGESLGVKVEVKIVNDLERLKIEIMEVGKDEGIDGVMVQLPIEGADEKKREEILSLIPDEKDVDGLSPDGSSFLPAVVVAVEKILRNFQVTNLEMAVVGSKGMVGKALMKRFGGARGFDIGDDLGELVNYDVVISATGQAGLIKSKMVKSGVVAIDLGYPKADFDKEIEKKARFFTPVPGGVGPVTIVSLFENLAKTS